MSTIEVAKANYEAAKSRRANADNIYRDVYRYAMPYRDMMYNMTEGVDKSIEIYDSTAVDSTDNFANFLHNSMTPPEFRWMVYSTGPDVPPDMKERVQALLDAVSEKFFYLLWGTNFDTEINQCYRDVAAGMGALAIRDYGKFGSEENAATFVATPPYEIYTLEGREGHVQHVYRCLNIEEERILTIWPDGKYELQSGAKTSKNSESKVKVIEACCYDYEKQVYRYQVFIEGGTEFILNTELKYGNWIVFRWSIVTGEMFGRGPLVNALADIKTANKVVELILKNASISLSGIYTAVDDGVLNPNTVELAPGTIIPVAYNGGNTGRSLDLLPRPGDFDLSQLVLDDLRRSIRKKLLDDDMEPMSEAVRSVAELAARQQRAADRAGPNIGRIRTEMLVKLVKELTTMWQLKGLLPPFAIDGKNITIRFTSPLARLQAEDDLKAMDMYIARLNTLHPGSAAVVVKAEEYAHWTAEKTGIPFKLINGKDQLIEAQKVMGAQIAQGGPEAQAIVEGYTE